MKFFWILLFIIISFLSGFKISNSKILFNSKLKNETFYKLSTSIEKISYFGYFCDKARIIYNFEEKDQLSCYFYRKNLREAVLNINEIISNLKFINCSQEMKSSLTIFFKELMTILSTMLFLQLQTKDISFLNEGLLQEMINQSKFIKKINVLTCEN